ncbi:MAG: ABC transporter substrate-binding protein, partial [Ketobacteraceae bacterium]|nr:ABC transporter substrate-binding protein [Ketobacteraceae bacterium]
MLSIRADRWYPMNGDPYAEKPGYMIELARLIMADHGYKVDYRILPWKRALKYVAKGRADC